MVPEQAAQNQQEQKEVRDTALLEAMFADDMGHVVMSLDRMALGMTLEQARVADTGDAGWI